MEDVLHTRTIMMKACLIAENKIRVTGRLTDDRPNPSMAPYGDHVLPAGTVQDMSLEIDVSTPGLVIEAARAEMHHVPIALCSEAEQWAEALVGLRIGRGITREIMNRLGGPKWCAHLRSLILSMTQVALQGDGAIWQRELIPPSENPRFHGVFVGGCHVWRADSNLPHRLGQMPSREPA